MYPFRHRSNPECALEDDPVEPFRRFGVPDFHQKMQLKQFQTKTTDVWHLSQFCSEEVLIYHDLPSPRSLPLHPLGTTRRNEGGRLKPLWRRVSELQNPFKASGQHDLQRLPVLN